MAPKSLLSKLKSNNVKPLELEPNFKEDHEDVVFGTAPTDPPAPHPS
jgi:hypothetical protein